jgi:thiol-disulfide isomerase/thioredoxin
MPVNWKEAQGLAATHQGKVVVLDIWSTSCEPCLSEFPHLVSLPQQHGADVVCMALNCDFIGAKNKPVDYYHERVLAALNDLKATNVVNLISTVPADELFLEMDIDSIPAVYVFGRDGKLVKRFDNRTPAGDGHEGISYEKQITPLVDELVKEMLGK